VRDDPALGTIISTADALGADALRADAEALAERIADGLFYVACLGQFKRGKSTLLNALVGHDILPAGIVPVTALPTVLRHGPVLRARIRRAGAWEDIPAGTIADWVAEERNPGNRRHAESVEVFVPSDLLAGGLCLVDTPGLGSVFEWNTAMTHAFVPHVDAAIVLVGADPPLSREELALVAEVARHTSHLIFLISKADRHTEAECAEAARFAEGILTERLGRAPAPIRSVSAVTRSGPHAGGLAQLADELRELGARSGAPLVESARRRGIQRLAERCVHEIEEMRGALVRPLDASARRLEHLRRTATAAEGQLQRLAHLFAAEEAVLGRTFEEHRAAFLTGALPDAARELAAEVERLPRVRGPVLRRQALDTARAVAQRWIEPWLRTQEPEAEVLYREAGSRLVALANAFLNDLAATEGGALARLPRALDPERAFRVRRGFYFGSLMYTAYGTSPWTWLADMLRPAPAQRRVAQAAARAYLERLCIANAARVESDLVDRVRESRRSLEAEVRSLLRGVCESAERAARHAQEARSAGKAAVRGRLQWLDELERAVQATGSDDTVAAAPPPTAGSS
jgi:hypothetical protein